MAFEEKHMYYVAVFLLNAAAAAARHQQYYAPCSQKNDCVSSPCFVQINDCVYWNKYIRIEIFYFPLSYYKMTCHVMSKHFGCNFNHQMDQFLFPVKVFIADKSVWSAKSNLQAECYIAPRLWKVSGVFKALSACLHFLSSCPAGHTILSQQGLISSYDAQLTKKDVMSCCSCSSGKLPSTFLAPNICKSALFPHSIHLEPTIAREWLNYVDKRQQGAIGQGLYGKHYDELSHPFTRRQ